MNRSNIICSDDTENNLKILLFFHVFVILLLYFILYNTIKYRTNYVPASYIRKKRRNEK